MLKPLQNKTFWLPERWSPWEIKTRVKPWPVLIQISSQYPALSLSTNLLWFTGTPAMSFYAQRKSSKHVQLFLVTASASNFSQKMSQNVELQLQTKASDYRNRLRLSQHLPSPISPISEKLWFIHIAKDCLPHSAGSGVWGWCAEPWGWCAEPWG